MAVTDDMMVQVLSARVLTPLYLPLRDPLDNPLASAAELGDIEMVGLLLLARRILKIAVSGCS